MKKNTKTTSKTRRDRLKRPELKKSYNLKTRRPLIESDYLNGVYSEDGEELIRPATEEEKNWYATFIKETVVCSFDNKKSTLKQYTQVEEEILKNLEARQKYFSKIPIKIKVLETRYNNELIYRIKKYIYDAKEENTNLLRKFDFKKLSYHDNNTRNTDLYSNSSARGLLKYYGDKIEKITDIELNELEYKHNYLGDENSHYAIDDSEEDTDQGELFDSMLELSFRPKL